MESSSGGTPSPASGGAVTVIWNSPVSMLSGGRGRHALRKSFTRWRWEFLPGCLPPGEVHCLPVDLSDLFPAADYEFRMGIRRGDPAAFFGPSQQCAAVISERRHWLNENPNAYLGVMPGGEALVEEFLDLCGEWEILPAEALQLVREERDSVVRLQTLSERLEPDLLFLAPGKSGQMELRAGAVCFPSSWPLSEKLGRPMASIHEPAPGLNESLSNQIDVFLSRLRPGVAWLRNNWGLSASKELNQHPGRHLPRLTPEMNLGQVWLRVERQVLLLLPGTGGVLFGLRIETEPLELIKRQSPEAADRLAHALRTMLEEIAGYKGIGSARTSLIEQLRK